MAVTVPFCDTPGQSALVGVLAGTLGGLLGVALDLTPATVVAVAALLAVAGDIGGHLVRRDDQFVAAVRQLTGADP